jgi:hypothetical protein
MVSTRFRLLLGIAACTFVLAACAGGSSQAPVAGSDARDSAGCAG